MLWLGLLRVLRLLLLILLLPLCIRWLRLVGLLRGVGGRHGLLVLVFVKSLRFEDGFERWFGLGIGIGIGLRDGLGMRGPSERVQRGSYWTDWTV